MQLDLTVNEIAHLHYLLNNETTVSDAEALERFLVFPIIFFPEIPNMFAKLLVTTSQTQSSPSLWHSGSSSLQWSRDCMRAPLEYFTQDKYSVHFCRTHLSIWLNDLGRAELWGLHGILALPADLGQIIHLP